MYLNRIQIIYQSDINKVKFIPKINEKMEREINYAKPNRKSKLLIQFCLIKSKIWKLLLKQN